MADNYDFFFGKTFNGEEDIIWILKKKVGGGGES
jgi:hypothetical protein